MPCLKQKTGPTSGAVKSSGITDLMKIEFICPTVEMGESSKDSEVASTGGLKEESVIDEEAEEEEEEEEEETDMVTALRNARARAVLKAIKDQAIADGTYVYVRKVKPVKQSSKETDPGDLGSTVESAKNVDNVPDTYWRSIEPSSTSSSSNNLNLPMLEIDLLAEAFINDGKLVYLKSYKYIKMLHYIISTN